MAHLRDISAMDTAYRSIMDASPVGIVIFDHDARVIYANNLAAQLFSKSNDALIGNSCGDFIACHRRHSDPRGCGYSEQCPTCSFHKAIQAALEGNTDPDLAKGEVLVQRESDQPPMWLKFKASGIVLEGNKAVVMAVDDIAEMKRAEAALQESVKRFKLMFMNAPMPYQSLDEQGNFIEVNQTFLDVLGYTRQDLIGKNFADILHPDWVDHFKHNFSRFKAIGEVLGAEFEMVKKDGTTILVFFNGKIQRDAQDRFESTHCIFQDITERRRAEIQLREKTVLLQNITDNMLDMVAITDLQGSFTYAGPSHRILGFEPAQIIGTSVFDYVHPDDAEYIASELADFAANPTPDATRTVEYRQRCADGSYLWLETKGKILFDDNGTPYSLFFSSRDVTERKHAANALRTAESLQRKMVANIGDVIVIIDEHGIIRYKSPNVEKWFGWQPVDLVGTSVLENVHPEDRGSVGQIFNSVLNVPNDTRTMEVRYRCKDSSYKWIQITGVNLLHDPDIKGILGNYRDITERKQAEQLSQEREQYLTSILQTTADGFWVVDMYGKLLDVNDAYCRMSGYTQTELLAMAISDLDAIETPEDTQERIKQIMNRGSAIFETRHRRKDGSVFDIEMSVTYQNIKDGQFFCFGRDITDRKEAIHALQESEGRFKTIIENLPGGVFAHDFDGRLLLVNEAASKNTGYSIRELLSMNVSDIDSGGYTREDREKLWNSLNIGEMLTIESWHTRKNGSKHPVEIHLNAIMFDQQPAILAIAFDISERRQAEETLRESEDKYRRIADNSADVVWTMDLNLLTTYVSPSVERVFGETPHEHMKKAVSEKLPPSSQVKVNAILLEELENEQKNGVDKNRTRFVEIEHYKADGSIIWVAMNLSFLRDRNRQFNPIFTRCLKHVIVRPTYYKRRCTDDRWQYLEAGSGGKTPILATTYSRLAG